MKRIIAITAVLSVCGALAATEIRLYPDGEGTNLRVPVIPPVPGGANHSNHVAAERVDFSYPLAPHIAPGPGSELTFYLRDLPRRLEKSPIELSDAKGNRLELLIPAASSGRGLRLRCGKASAVAPTPLPTDRWERFQLKLLSGKALLTGSAVGELSVPLPPGFVPTRLSVCPAVVDDLVLNANGATLSLDWEKDYSAGLTPAATGGGVTARLHGFDNFAVSTDPTRRDCPKLQLINSTGQPRDILIDCALTEENSGKEKSRVLNYTVPPRSELLVPLEFPFELTTDIYHLTAKISGTDAPNTEKKNFFYVEPRNEAAGPGLFGLHDCAVRTFGFWPDALPFRFAHKYLRWAYVIGPSWLKDWNGNYGLDPATPADQWNWNETIDWELDSGRELYVCLYGTPLLDWQRSKTYPRMRKRSWGWEGGFPELKSYAGFIRAAAQRYKGRIHRWEIENEPNASGHMPNETDDYAEMAKAVYRELKAVDPGNVVYGISGTSTFVPWMTKTLDSGARMDAVSWHTYTTPRQPDQAGLPAMLEEAKKVARRHGIDRFINSETGILTVPRYRVDQPIPAAEVAKKIAERAPGFVSANAWPGKVNNEWQASASLIKNAGLNLLAGAEGFVFFGWNPKWPKDPAAWEKNPPDFGLISCSSDGERTPNLVTLAVGVMTRQFEGVLTDPPPRLSGEPSVRGGFFRKANGGEVALLWSAGPTGTLLLDAPDAELETVTLYGARSVRKPVGSGSNGRNRFLIELTDSPIYIHARTPGMELLPSPVERIAVAEPFAGKGKVCFTLVNRSDRNWTARIRCRDFANADVTPKQGVAEIPPNQRRDLEFVVAPGKNAPKEIPLVFAVNLPGGGEYLCPVELNNKPELRIPRFTGNWNNVSAIALDRPEQAIVGRPTALASLQEDNFWGGPEELSGKLKLAFDDEALYITFEARDANLRAPSPWPGVIGSCVELFLDFRPAGAGLGKAPYEKGVYQILAHPAIGETPAQLYCPQFPGLPKVVEFSGETGKLGYTLEFRLPWKAVVPNGKRPGSFGFDFGINGGYPDKAVRKAQLMLYGSPLNFRDASGFGVVTTAK